MKFTIVTPTLIDRVHMGGLDRVARGLKKQSFKDFEWLVEVNTTGETDFNHSMNSMLRRARGEIVVSIQDFIEIEEDALKKISKLDYGFYTFPVGKVLKDGDPVRWDWRIEETRKCNFAEWEICFGCAPLEWIKKIGGFDEVLDQAWGFDNVNVGMRAEMQGYDIYCNNEIKAIAVDHDAFMKHPLKHKRDVLLHNSRLDDFRKGVKINYLA